MNLIINVIPIVLHKTITLSIDTVNDLIFFRPSYFNHSPLLYTFTHVSLSC